MAKRKHPKLPNGFGSIKKLSGNRTNKYGVYPPTTEFNKNGSPVSKKALCYVPDWYTGFYALMAYNNGTFQPVLCFREKQVTGTVRMGEGSGGRHCSDGGIFGKRARRRQRWGDGRRE